MSWLEPAPRRLRHLHVQVRRLHWLDDRFWFHALPPIGGALFFRHLPFAIQEQRTDRTGWVIRFFLNYVHR
jgi:hypothetical protein